MRSSRPCGSRAPLRDRQLPTLADAPIVDDLGDHIDSTGRVVERQHYGDVLVDPPFGKAAGLAVPEGAPEELVPRGTVVYQQPVVAGEQQLVPVWGHDV